MFGRDNTVGRGPGHLVCPGAQDVTIRPGTVEYSSTPPVIGQRSLCKDPVNQLPYIEYHTGSLLSQPIPNDMF